MLRLVQCQSPEAGRKVAVGEGDLLRLSGRYATVYDAALAAIEQGIGLEALLLTGLSEESVDYDAVYNGRSNWRLLPPFDHPTDPARCLVSGTGLTHRKSADSRNAMHAGQHTNTVTDSMRIYQWGVEGGRPEPGQIGVQPEWFYKGDGHILRAHGEALEVPAYAEDGGEEPEIAGAYVVSPDGTPYRVGFAVGNEFSDHRMESRTYLYLAPSKLRTCALGPELLVGASFEEAPGRVAIERGGRTLWMQEIGSGEANMVHTLQNLEHHHFKYSAHRTPGAAHIHFFGTGGFSFGAGITLEEGDVMVVWFEGFGRPLRNPLHLDTSAPEIVCVTPL